MGASAAIAGAWGLESLTRRQAVADDPEGDRPNFVWITSEDNSASWLPSYGHPLSKTPALDELIADGFRYTNCFANAPVCAPQRSTWLTGMYSLSLGTHHMRSRNRIPLDKVPLYPMLLKQAGYFCTNEGKTDYNASGLPNDLWDIAVKGEHFLWQKRPEGKPFFAVVNNGMTHEGSTLKHQEIETDPADVEIKPYHPDTPTTRHYYAQYVDSQYRMDKRIVEVVKQLKEDGLFENTIIVYCSDHGGALPRGKRDMRDTGLHCPLVVRIPEKFKHLWPNAERGTTVDRLVSFIDMPKTWLAMADIEIPDAMQGRVFLGPKKEPEPEYHYAFMSRYDARLDNSRAVRDKRFLYIRHYMPYAIYGGCVEYRARGRFYQEWLRLFREGQLNDLQASYFLPKPVEELYDTHADPDNIDNLAESAKHAKTLQRMRKQFREWQLDIHDSGLAPECEMARLAKEANTTVCELVRDKKQYDLAAYLDAADRALLPDGGGDGLIDEARVAKLIEQAQNDASPFVRYWSTVGLMLRARRQKDDRGSSALRAALDDEWRTTRVVAAVGLIALEGSSKQAEDAWECLRGLIEHEDSDGLYACIDALNAVDWLEESKRKRLLPAVEAFDPKDDGQTKAGALDVLLFNDRSIPERLMRKRK